MNVMVIGSGGREHAIIKSLKKNKTIDTIYALSGNGGIANEAILVDIGAKEIEKIVEFAVNNSVEYAVVAPDDPLVLGAVDALNERGIACFGPNKAAAIIEGSKIFSKNLMKKYNIPTAAYEVFDYENKADEYIMSIDTPIVVKADGLALGKGVIIAKTRDEAKKAVHSMMSEKKFGQSGLKVVIEQFLTGPEVSLLCFTDGKTIVPMISSMDHKTIGENNTGLNTGGMGAIAPNPYYTKEIADRCMKEIFLPTINAMNEEGRTFKGCLYFGLMLTNDGPKVIEYNCRFGDPETQVVLPLLKTDLFDVMRSVSEGRLGEINVEFSKDAACCVVMASGGYPVEYKKGYEITFTPSKELDEAIVYHAGSKLEGGKLLTNGGRVLGISATADTLKEAIRKAYSAVSKINFEDCYYRKDIGASALKALED